MRMHVTLNIYVCVCPEHHYFPKEDMSLEFVNLLLIGAEEVGDLSPLWFFHLSESDVSGCWPPAGFDPLRPSSG